MMKPMICKLALEDGAVFTGTAIGATGTLDGEVVFCTAMTGYQEVFTDPSYCGQIVTMTFPLQGNYGVNEEDFESRTPYLSGVVVRELPRRPSNFRATAGLTDFLKRHNIIGIAGVDTRAITRRIRATGALRGVLSTELLDDVQLVRRARAASSMAGSNLVTKVSPTVIVEWKDRLNTVSAGSGSGVRPGASADGADAVAASSGDVQDRLRHVVALDCGIKQNIPRLLAEAGCRVTLAPGTVRAEEILELNPDGVLVGNGPGDPAAVEETINLIRQIMGRLPIFGICLGHQLTALALGAETYKLPFGHHGSNLPVLDRRTGRVEITSQNHGFAVDPASLERVGAELTHVNLNDGTVEGFAHWDQQVLCVQFHPEASPGPHDARHLFAEFVEAVRQQRMDPEITVDVARRRNLDRPAPAARS